MEALKGKVCLVGSMLFLAMGMWTGAVWADTPPPARERLVVMPMHVSDDLKNIQGAMETTLAETLAKKYEVFSGERVAQKVKEIFAAESANAKHECDETRCMQNVAIAFQAELIAVASVTRVREGYYIALNIRNIADDRAIYSKTLTCRDCDSFQVAGELKKLVVISTADPDDYAVKKFFAEVQGGRLARGLPYAPPSWTYGLVVGYQINRQFGVELGYTSLYRNADASNMVSSLTGFTPNSAANFDASTGSAAIVYTQSLSQDFSVLGRLGYHQTRFATPGGITYASPAGTTTQGSLLTGTSSGLLYGLYGQYNVANDIKVRFGADFYRYNFASTSGTILTQNQATLQNQQYAARALGAGTLVNVSAGLVYVF